MTSEEKMREEFEAWAVSVGISITKANQAMCFANGRRIEVGGYILFESQVAYEAFKASRESLVIELPGMIGMNQPFTGTPISEIRAHNHFNDAITQCRKSIHAAGVKTK